MSKLDHLPLGLTFDDVLICPTYSTVSSRFQEDLDLSAQLTSNIRLDIPIVCSNMDTISEYDMAVAMSNLGGIAIIHRFQPIEEHVKQLSKLKNLIVGINGIVGCIGVEEEGQQRFRAIKPFCTAILIDVAHGAASSVVKQIRYVKEIDPSLPIIAGNIATYEEAIELITAGVHCIKCGIGGGSVCKTRIQTGVGVPQLTAIANVYRAITEVNTPIYLIADGGIRYPGDIVKALVAGADTVMIGNLVAGTKETPGKIYQEYVNALETKTYKLYRGLASKSAQLDWKGHVSAVEGELTRVPVKGSVKEVIKEIEAGIRSAMSYVGARNLQELHNNSNLIRITPAGYKESLPHGVR